VSQAVIFAYPGDLNTPTGGYGYDRRVISALSDLGWSVEPLSLGPGFPHPEPHHLQNAEQKLADLADGTLVLVDGLAFGVMDRWASKDADRLTIIALVHHPLAMETGLDEGDRLRLTDSETAALSHAASVLVTSQATASLLAETYSVPPSKILVAVPGVDPASLATGNRQPPLILSVGSLTRRKGHDVLISALERLADLPWTCRIVGSRELDRHTAADLERRLSSSAVRERIELVGAVDDVRSEFAKADIFALATRYEGYGMVFAEAMAHGLPVVGCRVGAVPDVVPKNAGLLVQPDDDKAFAAVLRRLLEDEELHLTMSDAAAIEGAKLPSWRETSTLISAFLKDRHGL
jgi:glycosyltransferase involved in cell wall biosynthesis